MPCSHLFFVSSGVDVYIRDFDGKCFHIRETPRVKVGHIARGISDQVNCVCVCVCIVCLCRTHFFLHYSLCLPENNIFSLGQISENVFSLQTEDGCMVPHDKEVLENSLFLRCVPAPDSCHYHQYGHKPCCTLTPDCKLQWSWRIREGVLETRD